MPYHVLQRPDAGQMTLLGAEVVHKVEVGTERQAQQAGHDSRDDDAALVHPAAWAGVSLFLILRIRSDSRTGNLHNSSRNVDMAGLAQWHAAAVVAAVAAVPLAIVAVVGVALAILAALLAIVAAALAIVVLAAAALPFAVPIFFFGRHRLTTVRISPLLCKLIVAASMYC